MPLGWRPEGLAPKPPLVEVTEQNQVRFRSTMFTGSKPYLILHIILGIALMMMVIDPKSPWGTAERWMGSIFLWHMIINWSGIMESTKWLRTSEMIRIIISSSFLIYFSGQPVTDPINLILMGLSLLSLVWVSVLFKYSPFY